MESMERLIEALKDSENVWKFQHRLGVRRMKVSRNGISVDQGLHPAHKSPRRKPDTQEGNGDSGIDLDTDSDNELNHIKFEIHNKYWYALFAFGTAMGDELFYSIFFPFWFWNIDGAVGRRVMSIWGMVMYIGQGLKDIIRWPRPGYPAIRLENKWALEYGMPSTHALVAVTVPFSVLIFTMYRYEYPFQFGLVLTTAWCALICTSRIYMGMHSFADVLAGLVLGGILMVLFIPCMDAVDLFQVQHPLAPLVTVSLAIAIQVIYPKTDRWTPARGDTAVILGSAVGCMIGAWINFQLGIIRGPPMPPPYRIVWPSFQMVGLTLLRTVLGVLIIVAIRHVLKPCVHAIVCFILRLNPRDEDSKRREIVELSCKFATYLIIGINITYLTPGLFRILGIERITMHTEV